MGSRQSWNESEILCKSYSGHLAALASFQELNFARNLCDEAVDGCWVGGRVVNSSIGFHWKWSDNTSYWNGSIFSEAPFPSNCTGLSCHTNNSSDLCTLVASGSASFSSERCNTSHVFICMLDIGMYHRNFMFTSISLSIMQLLRSTPQPFSFFPREGPVFTFFFFFFSLKLIAYGDIMFCTFYAYILTMLRRTFLSISSRQHMLSHALPQGISYHPCSCKWVDPLHHIRCSSLASCIQAEQEA